MLEQKAGVLAMTEKMETYSVVAAPCVMTRRVRCNNRSTKTMMSRIIEAQKEKKTLLSCHALVNCSFLYSKCEE